MTEQAALFAPEPTSCFSIAFEAAREVRFEVPGTPVGKGRHRSVPLMRNGRPVLAGATGRPIIIHHTPDETDRYENLVAMAAKEAMAGRALMDGPVSLEMWAVVTPPASWSGKKQRLALAGGLWPQAKPDLDNVLKLVADALNGVVWLDDKQVAVIERSGKRFGDAPRLVVQVRALAGAYGPSPLATQMDTA